MTQSHDAPRHSHDRSATELVSNLSDEVSRLVRAEVALAVAEMRRKAKRAGISAGLLGGAAGLALLAGGALAACAVLALAKVLPTWLAALLVGIALLVTSGMAMLAGKAGLRRAAPPIPEQALSSVQEDLTEIRRGRIHGQG